MRKFFKETCFGLENMRGMLLMSPEESEGGVGFGYIDSDGNYHWHSGVSWDAFANWEGTWYGGWVEDLGYVAPETFIYPYQFYGVYGFDWGAPNYYPNGYSGNNGGTGGWNPYQGGNSNATPSQGTGGGGIYIPYVSAIVSVIDSKIGPLIESLEEYAMQTYRLVLNGAKELVKDAVTSVAELCFDIYTIINEYYKDNYEFKAEIRQFIDRIRGEISSLYVEHELDKMTWMDLFLIWFFEIKNIYNTRESYLFEFGDNAWTTKDLMRQEGVCEARNLAYQAIIDGNYENVITHVWKYRTEEFWRGILELNVATSFLGSYSVQIVIASKNDGSYDIHFTVENSTTWESGTRLRHGNKGIIEYDIPRNSSYNIGLGGTMKQKWDWTENYRP